MKDKDFKAEIVREDGVTTLKQYTKKSPNGEWIEIENDEIGKISQLRYTFNKLLGEERTKFRKKMLEEKNNE